MSVGCQALREVAQYHVDLQVARPVRRVQDSCKVMALT